ncbi:MAG: glycosyltransferase [Sphingobacteriales bacterium]|nr:MAG: glycosyltransferase [Sphingobacteriales bacterium]
MITEYSFKTNNSLLKSLFHKIIGKKLLETANLHSTTEFEAKVFKQHVQPRSSYVIHNLVEFPERNPSTSEEEKNDTFRLLFLSRVDKKKGLELLFEAISTLSFAWTLTIAGTGDPTYVNALKQRAAELGITANIIWIGQVDNTFKFELIKESDVFCLTSYNENFANVVIESISQGTAVLVSDQVGLYEYVDANKLGIVCKMQSDDVVNKITQLHDDPTLLEDIKVQGPMIIQRDFDKKMLANKYIDMYNQILYSENT